MSTTLTTTVTELPESRVRVEAEVAPAEVERRMEQAARKLGNQLKIPGFRKGKVPPPVVIRRLGREYVLDEALRESLGVLVRGRDRRRRGSRRSASPTSTSAICPTPVRRWPSRSRSACGRTPSSGPIRAFEVERREASADDEAIDAEIERLRDRLATLETVERPPRLGDHVVMDYLGKLDGEPVRGR